MSTNSIINNSFFSCSSDSEYLSATDSDSSDSVSLHDRISSTFFPFPKFLNVVHINAQSIPCHYLDILATFTNSHVDAILISESFLKPSLPSVQYSLPGYKLIRNDRTGKCGGGVAIYLRADISYNIISASPSLYSGNAEYLFIELSLYHSKILLAVFYSPSLHINYFPSFENLLSDLRPLYNHVLILGDFNTCLLKNDSRSQALFNITLSYNMHLLPLSATHHAPNFTPSLLDLILVSDCNLVEIHGQFPSCFSYHDLVYVS